MIDYNLYKFLLSLFKNHHIKIGSTLLKIYNPHYIEVSNNSFTTATEEITHQYFCNTNSRRIV
jgi:hypothetical protein